MSDKWEIEEWMLEQRRLRVLEELAEELADEMRSARQYDETFDLSDAEARLRAALRT